MHYFVANFGYGVDSWEFVISYLLIPRFESASNRASSKDGFLVSSGDLCLVMYMYTIAKMDLDSTDMVIKDSRYICTLATMMTW